MTVLDFFPGFGVVESFLVDDCVNPNQLAKGRRTFQVVLLSYDDGKAGEGQKIKKMVIFAKLKIL